MESSIRAIRFTMEKSLLHITRYVLDTQSGQAFENTCTGSQPTVFLVASNDLEPIRRFRDLIVDREIKDARKGLGKYLLGHPKGKLPLIDSTYTSVGRLRYGISKLIEKSNYSEESSSYIIGAPDTLFRDLWQQAEEPDEVFTGKWEQHEPIAQDEDNNTTELRLLNFLKNKYQVPDHLANSYVGGSESVQLVRYLILVAAQSEVPVLITGDTGTGKEVVARSIHKQSSRQQYNFTAINCGAISKELLELELFGCEQDAIQKGYKTKVGLWQSAGKGTLFLNEIGELSLDHQAKILRALQENRIRRIGGTEDIAVHARVLAATNRHLFSMVQAGTFREDLYYRLRGFFVPTPALREHREDLPLIANHLWQGITKDQKATVPDEVIDELKNYK